MTDFKRKLHKTRSVVIISPRHLPNDIRLSHKIGRSLYEMGYQTTLLCRTESAHRYLGMKVVPAACKYQGLARAFLNLPALFQRTLKQKADIHILVNPDCLPLAILLVLWGRTVIYDTHEDFLHRPQLRCIIPKSLARAFGIGLAALEWLVAKISAATLVTQTDLVPRYGQKTWLIDNAPVITGPIIDQVEGYAKKILPQKDLTLIYAGILTKERGPELMLDIVAEINKSLPCRMHIVGRFIHEDLHEKCMRHRGWRYVDYTGQVPHAQSLAYIAASDFGLALLEGLADIPKTSITKLYEYMQFGTPFIASDFKVWRQSLRGTEAGLFLPPADPEMIAGNIISLWRNKERYNAMKEAGANYIETDFNWSSRARLLQNIILNLETAPTAPRQMAPNRPKESDNEHP